jgi:hypothetical protein
MIVYGETDREADPRALLRGSAERIRGLAAGPTPSHDALRGELIHIGEVEAAVGDALCVQQDRIEPGLQRLRLVSLELGRMFWRSWRKRWDLEARARLSAVSAELEGLAACGWPMTVRLRPPEGYAHYALYPEAYGEAAEAIASERPASSAFVVGIRSIGTSLSAVAGGALAESGIAVESWCVRPHGHPFTRTLALDAGLSSAWSAAARGGSVALVVDEGPGLSGSSFLAVLAALRQAGFAEERILLMPSWNAPAPPMAGEAASRQWERALKRPAEFDPAQCLLEAGGQVEDLSAGRWRSSLLTGRSWPAVQPQHERRKYLVTREDGSRRLWKFAGLGPYGAPRLARARALAEAGYVPTPRALRDGFLIQDFVPGRPLEARDLDARLVERAVAYLACRVRAFRTGRTARIAETGEMLRVNIREGLGTDSYGGAAAVLSAAPILSDVETVAVDSRMMPHEWLDTSSGLLKADALDHADDHFFPREQDVAWDVAGFSAEFSMSPERESEVAEMLAAAIGDRRLPERVPFYAIAYRAFHLGYAELAISALGADDADAARFRRRASMLAAELRGRLAAAGPIKSRAAIFGHS